jgi:general secretion pathway protein G
MKRRILALLAAALAPIASAQDINPAADVPRPYLRVTEADAGNTVRLEIAVREFHAEGKPAVFLAGAVHIADRSFYESLQAFLDKQDVVLFEGVKPAGTGDVANDLDGSDEARVTTTEHRLRFLGIAALVYKKDHGKNPESVAELAEGAGGRLSPFVKAAMDDAWGNPITLKTYPSGTVDLTSLGADGQPGGEGVAADLHLSDQKPITREERGESGHGLQEKLADALGLVFQLDAMTHDHPNWRSSDMSIDQVQQRLDESGANVDVLGMLEGGSVMAKVAGLFLDAVAWLPGGSDTLKLAMVEVLSRADDMLAAQGGQMAALFDVILHDRNAVVLADLKKVIETEPDVKSIAIIYGAGHLPDLQNHLRDDLGYTPAGDTWRPAITLDLKKAGIAPAEARMLREMLRRSIDMELKKSGSPRKERAGGGK